MTERPILFQGAMVRAILDGSKTQTRRAMRRQFPADAVPAEIPATDPIGGWVVGGHSGVWWCDGAANIEEAQSCPYGKPGDRLWVRESLRQWSNDPQVMAYAADDRRLGEFHDMDWPSKCGDKVTKGVPSIHMPRAWSRLLLEVTDVRVERLQDISDADAMAEGTPCYVCGGPLNGRSECDCHCFHRKATASDYRALWEQINGADSWAINPWVWVVEFRRLP